MRNEIDLHPIKKGELKDLYNLEQANKTHLTKNGDFIDELKNSLEEFIENIESNKNRTVFAIKLDTKLIGRIDVIRYNDNDMGIGYWIDHHYSGQGIMSGVMEEVVLRLQTDESAKTIWAGVTKGNTASERLLIKNGFELKEDRGTYNRFSLNLK